MKNNLSKPRILIFADPQSAHTIKWVNGLIDYFELLVVGLNGYDSSQYDRRVRFKIFDVAGKLKRCSSGDLRKIKYLLTIPKIKKCIADFKPEIIHTFYASSYGLISTFFKNKQSILSILGSDVFEFPAKSYLHYLLVKKVLKKARIVISSSNYMTKYVKDKFSLGDKVETVNYGIDLNKFITNPKRSIFESDKFIIGTIKKFEHYYGIEDLIDSFGIIKDNDVEDRFRLLLVGGGDQSQIEYYQNYVIKNKLNASVKIIVNYPYSKIEDMHNELDLAIYPSHHESFGVSLLESLACSVPVIVSDIPSFSDIIDDNVNGIKFPKGNVKAMADKILLLYNNSELRDRLKKQGRELIEKKYNFKDNVIQLLDVYEMILDRKIKMHYE